VTRWAALDLSANLAKPEEKTLISIQIHDPVAGVEYLLDPESTPRVSSVGPSTLRLLLGRPSAKLVLCPGGPSVCDPPESSSPLGHR
jgi:hypothetical protein